MARRRGRPPKPIEQKRLTGNPGKRKLPAPSQTVSLQPADGVPPVPITLKEHGRAIWTYVWTSPAKMWISPQTDSIRITTVCQVSDDIAEWRALIELSGPLLSEPLVTSTGMVVGEKIVPNPLVSMVRKAEDRLDKELTQLGLDPVSRSRLGLAEVKRQSKLEELLQRREAGGGPGDGQVADIIDIAADD